MAVGLVDQENANKRVLQTTVCHFYEDWQAVIDPRSNDWRVTMVLEALYSSPGFLLERLTIDSGDITDDRPTDIIDSRDITEERPTDEIDALTPVVWS